MYTLELCARVRRAVLVEGRSQHRRDLRAIHAPQGELEMRRIQGVLQLARQYGNAAYDDACTAALKLRVLEYRFVRRYLERSPQAPLSLRQIDPIIRELTAT